MQPLGLPFVDKGGNEVYAGLVGNDKSFLQAASHAQGVGAELRGGARLLVVAYVHLAQSFHVVHVHAHHVSQSVRQEEGVRSGGHGLAGVALHQAEFLQARGHQAAHGQVYVHPPDAGTGHFERVIVASLYYRVNVELLLGELPVDGIRARVVRAVVVAVLRAGVAEHEAAALKLVPRRAAVHYLAVLGEDGGEAHHRAIRVGRAVHLSANVFLGQSGPRKAHRRGVHLVAYGAGVLYFGYLLRLLGGAHPHHCADERHRGRLLLLVGVYAEQVEQLQLRIIPVRRQEVDGPVQAQRIVANGLQLAHRGGA